jgi:hypothetical protein
MMNIKTLALELEDWATKNGKQGGWKKITPLITAHHHGQLLESLTDITSAAEYARHLHNNTQIIQRAFRKSTQNYRRQADELAPAVRAAIDAEQAMQGDTQNRVATVNRECIEATSAALLNKPLPVIQREAFEAIDALAQLAGLTVNITAERRTA